MSSGVSTLIIIIILVVILFFAVKNSIPHFRGEGGCCGGSAGEKKIKPKKLDKVVDEKVFHIEGMRCSGCAVRVHNALNSIDGVNAKVNIEKKTANIKLGKEIDENVLKSAVEKLGYKVESK